MNISRHAWTLDDHERHNTLYLGIFRILWRKFTKGSLKKAERSCKSLTKNKQINLCHIVKKKIVMPILHPSGPHEVTVSIDIKFR